MQDIEPFYNWRHLYIASEDERSPFYEREYSEFEYTNAIYNYLIHPQWDDIESPTLYLKILFVDYEQGYAIIELIGEWNDCINNDIMLLKRDIVEQLMINGIKKFILIGENVLNYHASDDEYYQEWFEDVEDGWIAFMNFRKHVLDEFQRANIDYYIIAGGQLNDMAWRTGTPQQLFEKIELLVQKRIG
ncbi:MAG TPA: hypothetical protein PK289_12180 [Bacteroidia bacterium]|jgi:hypothetical protein|nr:hypothetical protein [Bacteroidia bacterium]HRG52248.1 hypothetical protein [Bacteroidia bacterium]